MLNVIAVMGRLVQDPELRKTPNGVSTCTFTIACDRNYTKPGEKRQADFFDIVAWRQSAEFVCKFFRQGQLIAVNGSLQTRSYTDKKDVKHKVYEILADNLHFASSKGEGGGQQDQDDEPPLREATDEDFTEIDDSEDLPF